ncbi:hypothetical protein BDZ85DRAFT_256322 [Elsinoe ampelina]|uniref:Uncharacterized protein n=1 Tax=Elsinoe ampelina TaxID=302913 RepID=A0A6A6GLG8_9PEZI|nr:hypothetical protein BDZ85DRAFT_256322 [Elsinoe ampelina]
MRPAGPRSPTYEGRGWPRSDDSDEDERPRHAKRRRLDLHSHTSDEKAHKYGHYGQVEPGRLKFELSSCDGGVHDDGARAVYYGPSNILRHDQSVYCSRSPSCNIIIRHHDNSAFALEKLYILGPECGFTSPVRHGTVCIGMGLDELMPLAAEALLYSARGGTFNESDGEDEGEGEGGEQLSLLESLRDPEISRAIRPRGEDWGQAPYPFPYPLPPAQSTSNRDGRIWPNNEFSWPALEPQRRPAGANAPGSYPGNVPSAPRRYTANSARMTTLDSGMQITFDCSEEVHWPEEPTTAAVLDDRRRREQRINDGLDSDEGAQTYQDRRFRSFQRLRRGIRQRETPSYPQMDSPRPGSTQPGLLRPPSLHQSGSHAGSSRTIHDVTKVKFHMEHRKSKVAIHFDPPVSGTCILLQLHGASDAENVDIQTVIACGYAGPRFLPATTLA